MPDQATVAYNAVLLCEDIRLEFDGKRTLIGAFTADAIHVPELPAYSTVALYAAGFVVKEGLFRGRTTVADPSNEIVYDEIAPETVTLKSGMFVQNIFLPLEIKREGVMVFTLFNEQEPLTSISYNFALRQPTPRELQALR